MGMDVYGTNPTADEGIYFRNNVWWWRPLADYILTHHEALAAGCTYWHTNDGDGLNADQSRALAAALRADLDLGLAHQRETERETLLALLPLTECWLCDGTGLRTDEVGRRNGLDKPRDSITGLGGCNGCSGTGKQPHPATDYYFSTENLTEFTAFLETCGGFEIC